ncbi:hypothetical protein FDF31_15465 [Clostridium sporogenes]|uniref:AtuA-related protein n=1 Tax=unclassified Clostridium TaxID=2614128 RepID=UPI0013D431C2|nr:hypothetical protein [Clostridium sporogenes]NFS26962.1 hypothetical protein [Clostridium sporogenes]
MKLKEIAHSRAGDKGNTTNVSLISYKIEEYDILKEKVTAKVVQEWFCEITEKVDRYELPQLGALNFVLNNSLGGGVTKSIYLDKQGKTLSSALLEMEINI